MKTREYRNEIEKATTINELVWIDTEYKKDMAISCDELLGLCRMSDNKKEALKKRGQKYTVAKKPAWK